MKKILVLFFLAISHVSIAQFSFGLGEGYCYNHLKTNISNRDFTKNNSKSGYCFGLLIKHDFTSLFSIQTGIGCIQKSYSFVRIGYYTGAYETFTNSYMQIPLLARLRILEKGKLKIHFNSGIYLAYWIAAKVNGATPNIFNSTSEVDSDGQIIQYFSLTSYSSYYQFSNTRDNRFEFGLVSGLGISYNLNNKYSMFLETNYYQSLTDQQKKYMINQVSKINQTFSISIGCFMKFTFNKK